MPSTPRAPCDFCAADVTFGLSRIFRSARMGPMVLGMSLYFNVFLLVVQTFEKVPAAHALAPTQKEPPFAVVHLLVLVIFAVLAIFAVKKFRAQPAAAEPSWTRTKAS